ncbi:MAG: serine/threonine protein kinase, partial [Cyanobacteriota bacterium SKYGB_h_bin112]|nr:serine/threonine protein kinase [Cyanobacteriota bacterium SKYGB_h_bin112]
ATTYPQQPVPTYPQQQAPTYPQQQAPTYPQPVNQPTMPPPTQAATIAVGRRPEPATYASQSSRQSQSELDEGRGLLDNPIGIGAIGAGIALAAGLGSWAVVNYLNSRPTPSPSPTPTIVLSPSPTTPSPTVTPSPSPVTINQPLNLKANQTQQIEGSLRANQTLNYQIRGKQGQQLIAALSGKGMLMTILTPKGQPVNDTAADTKSWQGALPADGDYTVRLSLLPNQAASDFKLSLTLNEPVPSPSPSPSPLPSPSEPIVGTQVRRINVVAGGDSVEIADMATPNTTLRYLVSLQQGQVLDAIVVSGLVTITIRYPDGTIVEDAGGLVQWQGEATFSGDYQIDVVAIEPTDFVLRVGVR